MPELDEISPTSREQEAAVALEYFRLDWPGLFAVPANAPPVPDTVRMGPECFEQTSASVAEAAERGDLPGLLSGFTGPVEVVAGERSPLPRQAAESTAAVFPDARLTIVPGAGRQVWHEAPGCLAAALSRVAARLAYRKSAKARCCRPAALRAWRAFSQVAPWARVERATY